jgi:hypothetical protein
MGGVEFGDGIAWRWGLIVVPFHPVPTVRRELPDLQSCRGGCEGDRGEQKRTILLPSRLR